MYHLFFLHSSVDGHLGCFHVLAILNSAAVNVGVHVSFELEFLSFLDVCPGVGLLDHMVTLILSFLRNLRTVLHSDVPSGIDVLRTAQHCFCGACQNA